MSPWSLLAIAATRDPNKAALLFAELLGRRELAKAGLHAASFPTDSR